MPNKILDELIAAKVSSDTIAAVAEMIAELGAVTRLRAQNAERQRRFRERHNVTSRYRNVTQRDPPVHILSPQEIKPKKVLSMQMPDDFALGPKYIDYAISKGWAMDRVNSEGERFKNHFRASGARKKDWYLTWCNWVTSPYQATQKHSGANPDDPLERRNGESLGALGRRLYAAARDREIAAGIDAAHDASPIGESGD